MPLQRNGEMLTRFQYIPEFKPRALQVYESVFCLQQILLTRCINVRNVLLHTMLF